MEFNFEFGWIGNIVDTLSGMISGLTDFVGSFSFMEYIFIFLIFGGFWFVSKQMSRNSSKEEQRKKELKKMRHPVRR